MALFIIGLIVALAGLTAIFFGVFVKTLRFASIAGGVVGVLIALLMIFGSMYNSVGPREVGVQTSFGKLGQPLQSGVHFTAPWTNVTICPLSEEYTIQNGDPRTGDALYNQSVPIAGSDQGSATADVTVAYHIDAKDVDAVYKLYKCDLTKIKDNAVAQRVRSDVAQAATQYVSTDLRSNRQGIEKGALALLQSELGLQGITVDSVTIADMQLSAQAQTAADNKVAAQNAIGVAQLHNQQAQIDKSTALINADAEQAANAAKQTSLTPQILCQQWIQAISQNQHLTVLNTSGPCSASTSPSNVAVQVPAG